MGSIAVESRAPEAEERRSETSQYADEGEQ
jgi:hypothetical protein